jgi:hypothetical protein
MCCKVLNIKELKKPPGLWCSHALPGKGCGIYADRPSVCQAFYCGWMIDAKFGPEWKPQKAKFLVWIQPDAAMLHVAVDPDYPNAWTKPPFYAQIKRWAAESAASKRFVFVRIGPRLISVLPDREVDLGVVDPEDKLLVTQRPGTTTFDVEVLPRESVAPPPDWAVDRS